METKKTTAKTKAEKAEVATPVKAKRKKREPRGWYMDKEVGKIPLDEFFKDEPEFTGPGRTDMLKKKYPGFGTGEILDMRAVLK
ncbi:MAG: hypothetical protein LBG47_00485 [Prevotellaceae bacterium]|jgi:hypothetical protein|nr:hypothetical protein [Prevotellaceae bacterium]